jgi:hypothetical protein
MIEQSVECSRQRRGLADVPLIVLTIALLLSLVVAFSAVSVGIARADTLTPFGGGGNGRVALAMLVGLIIGGVGGLTALLVRGDSFSPQRD